MIVTCSTSDGRFVRPAHSRAAEIDATRVTADK
jgi:hypothetical protein